MEQQKSNVKYQEISNYHVWLNDQDGIASFHAVDGYELKEFFCHEFFMSFIYSLVVGGYRFQ